MDYQIQPNSRRCAVTGRELRAGERYYSALVEEGRQFVRRDYSSEAWQGPPQDALGFWTGHVLATSAKTKPCIDDEMLEDCFLRLEGDNDPGRVNFRYVVALLLMRRRRFRFETSKVEAGVETLTLRCMRNGAQYEVINPRLSDDEMTQVQDEVFKVLGWN
jgi:hypothetical protein